MKTQIKHDENRISSNFKNSLRGQDSNLRPFGYEPNELTNCSTARFRN